MKKPFVGLIDTGTSNIKSVYYALKECGAEVQHVNNYESSNKNLFKISGKKQPICIA